MNTYNRGNYSSGPDTFGFNGDTISLANGDFNVDENTKAVVVVSAGNVVFRPVDAESDITITGLPAGYIIPWHCAVIRQTGTSATLSTLIGRA